MIKRTVDELSNLSIRKFIKHESASGILLIAAALLALMMGNTALGPFYDSILTTHLTVQIGNLGLDKPLLLWINDGLMAVFFFLIGLEIKREVLEGELSSPKKAVLPFVAALGGIIVPAALYLAFTTGHPYYVKGWGIPMATDIAFALGIMALLGNRIPRNLKILLLSLAIIDDIAAILIIAVFYTASLSLTSLALASAGLFGAFILNRLKITRITPYVLIGVFIWFCVLKSGIHATIAGVLLAMFIPLKGKTEDETSPLKHLEHELHPWVSYMIMPLFAFANAGVMLSGYNMDTLLKPASLGIITGLFIGKQLGIFTFVFVLVKTGLAKLPEGIHWGHLYGMSLLCGIGFTMSLFIGTLAFDDLVINGQVRVAVLIASTLSAVCGYIVLRLSTKKAD